MTTTRALRDALRTARRAMVANPSLVAYSGVLLKATPERVYVTGSDGETTITARFDASDLTEGQVLVAPEALAAFLDTFRADEPVALAADDSGDLAVTVAQRSPYTFRALHATFPTPTLTTQGMAQATLEGIAAAVGAVKHASSGTLQFVSTDDHLTLNATDTYRLAQARLPGAGFGSRDGVALLTAFEEIARHPVTHVGVDARGRELRARGESVYLSSRLVDEPFPAVDSVLGTPPGQQVEIDRNDLLVAITRLAPLAERTPVKLSLTAHTVTCAVSNVEVGAGTETVALERPVAEEFSCSLQLGYLEDALKAHGAQRVTLAYSSPLAPLFLRSEEPVPTVTVVMPVRRA